VTSDDKQLDLDIEPHEDSGAPAEPAEPDIGEDLNAPMIAAVGVVATIVVLAVIMLLVGLYHSTERAEVAQKYSAIGVTTYDELHKQQMARIGSYGWVDVEDGVVSIPVDRAVALTAAELARDQAVFVLEHARQPQGSTAEAGDGEPKKGN